MNWFSKKFYKPRFVGYYLIGGILQIINGILTIVVSPFGYTCDIHLAFGEWNIKQDMKRWRKNRTKEDQAY